MEGGTMEKDHRPNEGFKIELNSEGMMMIPGLNLIIPSSDLAQEALREQVRETGPLPIIRNTRYQRRRRSR